MFLAEDIIGIDDIQLLDADGENAIENSPAITGLLNPPNAGQPKNPFDGIEEVAKGEEMKTRIFPVPSNSGF